jgi:hypothetical protein
LWAGAFAKRRGTGLIAIAADVEYDEHTPGAGRNTQTAELRVLAVKKERAETAMTRSHARFVECHQPHGVR